MTEEEAIEVMNKTIDSRPDGIPIENCIIYVTVEIANLLVDYNSSFMGTLSDHTYKKKGDTFLFRGIQCEVL